MTDMRCPECMSWLTVEPVAGQFPYLAFQKYVKAMPQSEAQTALIYLVNFMVECASRQNVKVQPEEIPSDMTPQAEAILQHLGDGE